MAYMIDTFEDKIRFELGARDFAIEQLRFELEQAHKRIQELESKEGGNSDAVHQETM